MFISSVEFEVELEIRGYNFSSMAMAAMGMPLRLWLVAHTTWHIPVELHALVELR